MAVSLTWDFLGSGVQFNVYRSTSPIPEQNPGEPLAAGIITAAYIDNSAPENTLVYYRVESEKNGQKLISEQYQIQTAAGGDICDLAITSFSLQYDFNQSGNPPFQDFVVIIAATGQQLSYAQGQMAAYGLRLDIANSPDFTKIITTLSNQTSNNIKLGFKVLPADQGMLLNPVKLSNGSFTYDPSAGVWNGCLTGVSLTPSASFDPLPIEINRLADVNISVQFENTNSLTLIASQDNGDSSKSWTDSVSGARHIFSGLDFSQFTSGDRSPKPLKLQVGTGSSYTEGNTYFRPVQEVRSPTTDFKGVVFTYSGNIFVWGSGGNDFIYRSVDEGETFQDITSATATDTGIAELMFAIGDNLVYNTYTFPYKVYCSLDQGSTWNLAAEIPEGVKTLRAPTFAARATTSEAIISIGSGSEVATFMYTLDGGLSWSYQPARTDGFLVNAMTAQRGMSGVNKIFACGVTGDSESGYKRVIMSADSVEGGWTVEFSENIPNIFGGFVSMTEFKGDIVAATSSGIYVRDNVAETWFPVYSGSMRASQKMKITNDRLYLLDSTFSAGYMYSSNGRDYFSYANPSGFSISDIVFTGYHYTAVGKDSNSGENTILHSYDGVNWQKSSFAASGYTSLTTIESITYYSYAILAGTGIYKKRI